VGGWLISYPGRSRVMRENVGLMTKTQAVYDHIGGDTISARRLREMVDFASRAGVVFDGAVFAIIDRMVAADPTAFVLGRSD
jgi:hypothetical protein